MENEQLFLEGEEWKDVKGYEGLYQVSSLSRFKQSDKINYRGKLRIWKRKF